MLEIAGGIIIAVAVIFAVFLFFSLLSSQDGRDILKIVFIPIWMPICIPIVFTRKFFSDKKFRDEMIMFCFGLVFSVGCFALAFNSRAVVRWVESIF